MQKKRINPWSLVAVLSAIGFCPLFTIAAILFGIRALVDIKAKGDTRGVRLSWFAILFGSLVTGLWGGGMYWWDVNVRAQIELGPIDAISHGQNGKVESFESEFLVPYNGEETGRFLAAINKRYGALITGKLDQEVGEADIESDKLFLGMVPMESQLEYVLQFTNKEDVHLTVKYVLFETTEGRSAYKNKFAWFQIDDEELGNLVYPPIEGTMEQNQNGE
ncbi:MAG: hypothetical protein CMJ26_05380 [Phycisphaerae bacterium]|nr:hypothetical protein [Phycisphaerae bacterium]